MILIAEEKHVHHQILKSIESSDEIEADGAIFAADRLCAYSRAFATALGQKIFAMIDSMSLLFPP